MPNVVITLGSSGAYVSAADGMETRLVMAPPVTAVDTTAASDCFDVALTAALAEGQNLFEAEASAYIAASISVTRLGAQASLLYRHEVSTLPLLIV